MSPQPRRRAKADEQQATPPDPTDAREQAAADDPASAASPASGAEAPPRPAGRRRAAETTAGRPAPTRRRRGEGAEAVTVRAQAKYLRTAPRKVRLVVDHIRGKSVEEARAILTHTPRGASKDVLALLNSCVANAENNHELGADELRIARAYVDEGPTLKRYRPRALGRATPIRKRTSHMTILLTNKE